MENKFEIGQILCIKDEYLYTHTTRLKNDFKFTIIAFKKNGFLGYSGGVYNIEENDCEYSNLDIPMEKHKPYRYCMDMFESLQTRRRRKIKKY